MNSGLREFCNSGTCEYMNNLMKLETSRYKWFDKQTDQLRVFERDNDITI